MLAPGSLLLAHARSGWAVDLARHTAIWGPLPRPDLATLADAAEHAGIRGHGGAGFPTERKLRAVGGDTPGPVIVNGSEGESASGKDTVLLTHVPHLVLDGAVATARALGTRKVVVRVPHTRPHVVAAVRAAIAERTGDGVRITVRPGPDSFIAGEATAVIAALEGRPALPEPQTRPPAMRTGLRRRPVMLSNVETFARLAVAARACHLTSTLVTVSGAVGRSGVLEVPTGTTTGEILQFADAEPDLAAVITGGWHGTWLPADDDTFAVPFTRPALSAHHAHLGAGALVAIPRDPCPALVLQAVADHLVGAGAGQCAPCVLGMAEARRDLERGDPVADRVRGRGLCAHPTATLTALQSGQRLLAAELAAHAQGHCEVAR